MPTYKTVRLREGDYKRLKEVQKLLRNKGLESIDWVELRRQNFVEVPEEDEDDSDDSGALTWGFILGLGAAAIAYLVAKNLSQGSKSSESDRQE
jgi:hypothetical protein